jgi:hypothetical protein
MPTAPNSGSPVKKSVLVLAILVGIILFYDHKGRALPPPFSEAELTERSDLIIEGQVIEVWLYDQWLYYLKSAEMGSKGITLLQKVPATTQQMLKLIRNFPYKKAPVVIDGVYVAAVKVDKRLKGQSEGVIFIPFVSYHFPPGRRLIGPWSERGYRPGEHLKMYLRKNGPFFESTWWNAVQKLPKPQN